MASAKIYVNIEVTEFGKMLMMFIRCMCVVTEALHSVSIDITDNVEAFGFEILRHIAERHLRVREV